MARDMDIGHGRHGGRKVAIWAAMILLVLLVPLVAMQFTAEVAWTVADFVVAGILLSAAALAYELMTGLAGGIAYRAAAGLAVGTALLLAWMNLAVGLIGSENNPANLMYAGVLAILVAGAALARLRPAGMARALVATALAQALVALVASGAGLGGAASPAAEILGVNALFVALWLLSAWLFRAGAAPNDPKPASPAA